MLSDAKKKANAKWDMAHMMILGCKVRKDFAAQFREACTAAGTTPNAVLKQAAEQLLKEHAVSEGKTAVEILPGTVIHIPANVKHWHGAAADCWFAHLAFEVPGESAFNEWLEPVTDEEYDNLETNKR